MKPKSYLPISALIFALVALIHLIRIILSWNFEFGSYSFPLWISWFPVVFLAILSIWGFKLALKQE